ANSGSTPVPGKPFFVGLLRSVGVALHYFHGAGHGSGDLLDGTGEPFNMSEQAANQRADRIDGTPAALHVPEAGRDVEDGLRAGIRTLLLLPFHSPRLLAFRSRDELPDRFELGLEHRHARGAPRAALVAPAARRLVDPRCESSDFIEDRELDHGR